MQKNLFLVTTNYCEIGNLIFYAQHWKRKFNSKIEVRWLYALANDRQIKNIQFLRETSVGFLRRKKSPYFYREKVFWHINEPKKARVSIFCCCFFFPPKTPLKWRSLKHLRNKFYWQFSLALMILFRSFIFRIIFQLYCYYMVLEVLHSALKWGK